MRDRKGGIIAYQLFLQHSLWAYLKNLEAVYHFNGQQTETINGDKASRVSYCMVTLIDVENDKKMKTPIAFILTFRTVCYTVAD